MAIQDVGFLNRSPARAATPPRTSILSATPNTSPTPRVPLGRSPQRASYHPSQAQDTRAVPAELDALGRTSIDSAAIFSIYSMYGSDGGVSGQIAARGESQGPSRLASSYNDNSRASTPSVYGSQDSDHAYATPESVLGHEGQVQHQPQDLSDYHHHHQGQRPQSRTSSQPASSFLASRQVRFDDSDRTFGSSAGATTAAANSVSPPCNFTTAGVNGKQASYLSSTNPHKGHERTGVDGDDDDDESLIDFGCTQAGGSRPSSGATSKTASMSLFSSPSKIMKQKISRGKSTASTASTISTAYGRGSELAYFDTGVMPSVPPPPRAPSALSSANSTNRVADSNRNSYIRDDETDGFGGNLEGVNGMSTKNSNRMSMCSWLPDPSTFMGRQSNGIRHASSSLPQQSAAPSLQLERQPPASSIPSAVLSQQPTPPSQHSLSTTSAHSHSSSVYATPVSGVSQNAATFFGEAERRSSLESAGVMPAQNGANSRYHTPSSSSSRRNSPSPSLPCAPVPSVPPSSYQANALHSMSSSRRQTPSPAPSRTGSLAAPPPSIIYPQPQDHSPHSSLSHNSNQSHQSYGASSVITKDTAVSMMSGTTATTSASGVDPSAPPVPVYQQPSPPQLGASPIGRLSQASSSYSNSQAHQSYTSSAGHRSTGFGDIPRFDKDLSQNPEPSMARESGAANWASGQSGSSSSHGAGGGAGERRPSPVPSLNVNGSPHPSIFGGGNSMWGRQSRLTPVGLGAPAMGSLSPSVSQQSTATTATTGTSATVSSTGATTANSTPDPNLAGQGFMMSSPHASLTPHRSSSSIRNGVNSSNSPHHSVNSTPHLGGGGGSSIKAHSILSLVPSLGEDLDAFHVRNTYALLEISGVKGDGYEEGVERTRAARTRLPSSVSRSPSVNGADTSGSAEDGSSVGLGRTRRTKSQVLADAAIADGNEKKRELDPKELQVLGSLDRYGFFTVPSHDRLLSLPSQPLLRPLPFSPSVAASASPPSPAAPPSPSQYPASGASATPKSLSALPPVLTPGKEGSRIAKWGRMIVPHARDEGGNVQAWRIRPNKVGKVRRRTYKGIPDRWRAAAWEVMMTAYSNASGENGVEGRHKSPSGSSSGEGNVNSNVGGVPVETIVEQMSSASAASWGVRDADSTGREYRDALEKASSYDIQIDLDVPRTISGHIMFRTRYGAGQRSLFHVLHSFSLRCPSCGYVQGMGPIAATLLSYMSPSLAYTSLVRLHDAYSLHSVFSPGFPGLLEAIYVQERITQTTMPSVYAAFQKHMISTTSYATKWYITLFANSVPFQTQLRLWDVFLLEGYDVYIAVAVAVVWVYRDHITSAAANFETVLSLLSGFFVPEDENVLLGWIEKMLGDRRIRRAMRGWRVEWRELVRQGKEGTVLL